MRTAVGRGFESPQLHVKTARVNLTWLEWLKFKWLHLRFTLREMNYAAARMADPRIHRTDDKRS